jgi:hypothetical protein
LLSCSGSSRFSHPGPDGQFAGSRYGANRSYDYNHRYCVNSLCWADLAGTRNTGPQLQLGVGTRAASVFNLNPTDEECPSVTAGGAAAIRAPYHIYTGLADPRLDAAAGSQSAYALFPSRQAEGSRELPLCIFPIAPGQPPVSFYCQAGRLRSISRASRSGGYPSAERAEPTVVFVFS